MFSVFTNPITTEDRAYKALLREIQTTKIGLTKPSYKGLQPKFCRRDFNSCFWFSQTLLQQKIGLTKPSYEKFRPQRSGLQSPPTRGYNPNSVGEVLTLVFGFHKPYYNRRSGLQSPPTRNSDHKDRAYKAFLQGVRVFISHLIIEIAMTIPKTKRIHFMCGDALSPR